MNIDTKAPIVDSLIPVGFRVLVNAYKPPRETAAGFALPENENDGMPVMAQITVVGKKTIWEKFLILIGLKPKYSVGQWVYFRKYSVDELQFSTPEGKIALFVLEESEIIGVVNDTN